MNKTNLVVVSVDVEDISVKIQVATEDYSAIYDLQLFKQEYDKDSKTWVETEETTKRYNEYVELLGGIPKEDDTISVFVNEETGKAYVTEPKAFTKVEKPSAKDAGKLYMNMTITEIKDSPKGREVIVDYKGTNYSFSFNSGVWVSKVNKFIPNPAKLAKAKARFNELFEDVCVKWENPELAIGLKVNATVNKNALDPKSEFGWLSPLKLEEQEFPTPKGKEVHISDDLTDDDLPF